MSEVSEVAQSASDHESVQSFCQSIIDGKVCKLGELIAALELQSQLDLQSMTVSDKDLIRVRNEELFPFIKENSLILPNRTFSAHVQHKRSKSKTEEIATEYEDDESLAVCMAAKNVIKLIAIMIKVLPELAFHLPTQPSYLNAFLG